MSQSGFDTGRKKSDVSPGEAESSGQDFARDVLGYLAGLVIATALTIVSFFIAHTSLVWAPSLPVALGVLAIAQMGTHLVFFLHVGSGPDSTNNIMALAFGVLIVFLVITGSLWIMSHLDHTMMPIDRIMQMQR